MIIELTQMLMPGMPVYPGTEGPVFNRACTIEEHGFAEMHIGMYSHTGTHIDAPSHMILGGKNLDDYPVSHFVGEACMLDLTHGIPDLEKLKSKRDFFKGADFIIIRTGWSSHWGNESYYYDFPVLPPEHISWFLSLEIKGFGIDAISMDAVGSETFENHKLILEAGCTITENLTHLDRVHESRFRIVMLPLRIKESDGFSCRAFAEY
jgi:arylformamidase